MPLADRARQAAMLVRRLHGERADVALRELSQLYPRAVFHHDATSTGLTILYPQGMRLPQVLQLHSGIIIEVRPDSIRVTKDLDGALGGVGAEHVKIVWKHFQRCTGLTPDGILGPATKAKMRELAVMSNGNMPEPEPKRKSALDRLLGDDEL
jgi:murein L,D-transpeptidase YcbB/YkuD